MKIDVSLEQLAILAQNGDTDAMERIVTVFDRILRKKAKNYHIMGASSDDVKQEGLIALFKAVMTFDPKKSKSFEAFALMCINRRITSEIKSARCKKHEILNSCVPIVNSAEDGEYTVAEETIKSSALDPEYQFILTERRTSTRRKITGSLSKKEMLVLNEYLQNKNYDEIAETLGIDKKSVDNALQRIKHKLKRITIV